MGDEEELEKIFRRMMFRTWENYHEQFIADMHEKQKKNLLEKKMKTKQEQIEGIAPHMCFVCEMNDGFHECIQHGDELCGMVYEAADRIYAAGYRKASDVIEKVISSVKSIIKTAQISKDEFLSVEDYEWLWNKLTILAAEMRQEVEK